MPGTYTPAKGDALSRARFLSGDTNVAGTPRFSDDEVKLALRNTWEPDFIYVYQSDSLATAATVEIRVAASRVEVVLSRTVGPVETDTFDLSSGLGTDQVWELLQAVQALERGWSVGLASGRSSITWIEQGVNLMPADYASGSYRRVQLLQRTWDLALTGSALDCNGVEKRQRIPIYRPRYAAAELLRMWLSRDDTLSSYSEDGVSVSWSREGVQARIGELVGLQVLSVQSRL